MTTRSPLPTPKPAQHSGEARGLVQQLAVGVGALRPGHGGVVDQRRLLGAAPVDVAVQRVGAGVQLAVGKPAVERRIGVIEDALRFAGPCHRPRGVGPEGRGIGDAGVEQVAITAHTGTVARKRLSIVRFMTAEPPPIEGGCPDHSSRPAASAFMSPFRVRPTAVPSPPRKPRADHRAAFGAVGVG